MQLIEINTSTLWGSKFAELRTQLESTKRCRPLLYCFLVGTFPFNSFLSGFISCVGSFILINPQNKGDFLYISPERAFVDFLFAHTVLHLVVMNFIG
uniref:Dolichyl-diphosphooligosaccharide--protein glycosyltransferase subunit DAD1 n=1 Tax=Oreochromis aureus TaxID=47969 RepID=A0A668V899_OREAU